MRWSARLTPSYFYQEGVKVLAKNDSTPLYLQLKELIKGQVQRGELKPGDQIPSERELCQLYGISRITVRQAIEAAVSEGLLYRQPGKGTFVAKPRIEQGLSRLVDFATSMRSWGLEPSTQVLGWQVMPAEMQLAHVLQIPPGKETVNLRLLGLGSGEPMVYYDAYFPHELGLFLTQRALEWSARGVPFSTFDLYDRTSSTYPVRVEQAFEATLADEAMARVFKARKGSALLVITSIFLDREGNPTEFRKAWYRGEKYRFYLTRNLE